MCREDVGDDFQSDFLEGVVAFAEAVQKEGEVFVRESL